MKRRQPRKLRDRRTGQSPYATKQKQAYHYPFATGKAYREAREAKDTALIVQAEVPGDPDLTR